MTSKSNCTKNNIKLLNKSFEVVNETRKLFLQTANEVGASQLGLGRVQKCVPQGKAEAKHCETEDQKSQQIKKGTSARVESKSDQQSRKTNWLEP